jgi:NAD(P)H dehydrogenase (quinone)
MARIEHDDATVMVFPVHWWSMPAILKGWIDRVWNNGWAYGARKFPQRRVWMIGIAGTLNDAYQKRGYDTAMQTQVNIGILDYSAWPIVGSRFYMAGSKASLTPLKS